MSLGAIVFVGAVAWGATGAFFSDTETSTGNTFSAGAIDLTVDSTQHYNGNICTLLTPTSSTTLETPGYYWVGNAPYPAQGSACSGTWLATNLGPTNQFFNFNDIKPGDEGENTISLHIDNNDAYACADISNIHNNDNTQTEPEAAVDANGLATGELASNLDFLIWSDNGAGANAGNNIWDADEVGTHSAGAPVTPQSFTLADSGTGAIPGTQTRYLGFAWCAGTFTAGGPGITPVCNGTSMGNNVQTDSYTADISLRVEQARNNGNFTCTAPASTEIDVTTNDLQPNTAHADLATAFGSDKWFFYNDESDVIDNSLGSFVSGPGTPPLGSNSAQMTVTGSQRRNLATYQFSNVPLSTISAMSFSTLAQSAGDGSPGTGRDAYLNFNVDFNGSDTFQNRLVFVPKQNGSVVADTWQNWDAIQGGAAKWSFSGSVWPTPTAGPHIGQVGTPGTTLKTWADILADYPGIKTRTTDSWLGMRVGEPYANGFTGNVDKFSITIGATTKTFDFGN